MMVIFLLVLISGGNGQKMFKDTTQEARLIARIKMLSRDEKTNKNLIAKAKRQLRKIHNAQACDLLNEMISILS